MTLGRSTTPATDRLVVLPSVEMVSGQKPAAMTWSTMSHRTCPVRPLATSNQMPRRRASSTAGSMRPASSTMALGGGASMWVTTSPGFSKSSRVESGDAVWPMWIITGRSKAEAAAWARRSTSTSSAATPSVSRALTPTTMSRCRAMASRAASTSARSRSMVSPPGRMPARPMLTRMRPCCGAARAMTTWGSMSSAPADPASTHAVTPSSRQMTGPSASRA